MKPLFLLLSALGVFLNANEIYYDESNTFLKEVVGKYDDKAKRYPNATTKQLESLEHLVVALLELFNIDKTDIYAHAKIAYKDENSAEGVYLLEYLRNKL